MNIETEQSGYILNTGAEPVLELPGKPEALNVRASESALVVDKVKEPQQVMHLWWATHPHRRYVDLSPAFLHEDSQGWMRLIEGYEALHGKRAGL